MSKHGETLARAKTIIDNGPPLSVGDLALHLGMTYSGARRVAEALVAQGRIEKECLKGGMVLYGGHGWYLDRLIEAAGLQRPTKSLWTRFSEWMRK